LKNHFRGKRGSNRAYSVREPEIRLLDEVHISQILLEHTLQQARSFEEWITQYTVKATSARVFAFNNTAIRSLTEVATGLMEIIPYNHIICQDRTTARPAPFTRFGPFTKRC
jgi:hypothetical protein